MRKNDSLQAGDVRGERRTRDKKKENKDRKEKEVLMERSTAHLASALVNVD